MPITDPKDGCYWAIFLDDETRTPQLVQVRGYYVDIMGMDGFRRSQFEFLEPVTYEKKDGA